jgi:transposase-like protein
MQRVKKQRSRLKKIHRPHWYIPNYIEFDFRTLRGALVYYPTQKEIVHPFLSNINDIINFYKNKNL